MRLAVVGAGSTYTPELVDGLIRMQELLPVEELTLYDPAEERLQILGAMTRRMLDKGGHPTRLTQTMQLDQAVEPRDELRRVRRAATDDCHFQCRSR